MPRLAEDSTEDVAVAEAVLAVAVAALPVRS